ncbi:hypothetical protein GWK47_010120 [Chionoecetes opilio]|uniref:Uncharacterized protein n=1 Tax=Chionoecetes opilio TaxID=41210 RepID=A0A8J5CQJ5_CHIOP|nr:hypothetical protein GWK47_010120 [Chionoecetes opilio]
MTDDDDIIKQTTKFLVVGNTLQRKFSYYSREVKMELFRSHCCSIYCNSLWSRYKVATLNCLKVCHNDILKRLLGLPRWCSSSLAFARNGVNNLDVIRRHSVFSLRSRVELSTNSITSVRQSSAYVCGPIQQWWLGLLFVQNENVDFANFWDNFYEDPILVEDSILFGDDGLHLSPVGHARLGRLLNDKVSSYRSKNGERTAVAASP